LTDRAVAALRSGQVESTGKLHRELHIGDEMSRDVFEEVLGAMARAGLVRLSDAVFRKGWETDSAPYGYPHTYWLFRERAHSH
jgi:hypothetical protein